MDLSKKFILKDATIIDVESGTTFMGAIEVDHGYIKNIYFENSDLPSEIETIDVEGKYIIPGLIDMHCHIKEDFAPQFVASGVTTVRNTAGNVYQLKKLIESPIDAPTPRVYSADRMIDGPPGLWGPQATGILSQMIPWRGERKLKGKRMQVLNSSKFMDGFQKKLWKRLYQKQTNMVLK